MLATITTLNSTPTARTGPKGSPTCARPCQYFFCSSLSAFHCSPMILEMSGLFNPGCSAMMFCWWCCRYKMNATKKTRQRGILSRIPSTHAPSHPSALGLGLGGRQPRQQAGRVHRHEQRTLASLCPRSTAPNRPSPSPYLTRAPAPLNRPHPNQRRNQEQQNSPFRGRGIFGSGWQRHTVVVADDNDDDERDDDEDARVLPSEGALVGPGIVVEA